MTVATNQTELADGDSGSRATNAHHVVGSAICPVLTVRA